MPPREPRDEGLRTAEDISQDGTPQPTESVNQLHVALSTRDPGLNPASGLTSHVQRCSL
ncbi:hypothetical protein IG631_13929 [Alternaria alternata]|nr:hypothetical protein IG631_13929 [Alternaria alternata]